MADLRACRSGEGLAGRAAGNKVQLQAPEQVQQVIHPFFIGQIGPEGEPGEVGPVGLEGSPVVVDRQNHPVPGLFQAEREAAGAGEEVHGQRTVLAGDPAPPGLPAWRVGMTG